jgi:hypothetical protein
MGVMPGSDTQVTDMIKLVYGEFNKAHREAMLEPYDKLLEEVYDVSEDDISIDYEVSDQVKEILTDFKLVNWMSLNENDRLDVINKLVDTVSDELEIKDKPKIVLADENEDFFGAYDPQENTIILNRRGFIDPRELVDTITHELRHAYQHMRAEKLETHEDALFRVNLENYISPEQNEDGEFLNFYEYQNQYVEVDAMAFADKFTEAIK